MNTPNKRPTNHKTEERLFNKGINNTSDNDLQGVINKEAYLDAVNARLSSRNNFASLERIDVSMITWIETVPERIVVRHTIICLGKLPLDIETLSCSRWTPDA